MRVGLLGKSGQIAQTYRALLAEHPWFELTFAASRSGPDKLGDLPNCPLLFSALPDALAQKWDFFYAEKGYTVITNAPHCRLDPTIPLIIPEVNPQDLSLLTKQPWKGQLIAKPNCALQSFLIPLAPLHTAFGIEKLHVTTYQAMSGSGSYDPAFDQNVIPYIEDEEEKCCSELHKILKKEIPLSIHCNRVGVKDGHLASLSLSLCTQASLEEIRTLWKKTPPLALPSAPSPLFHYCEESAHPQPRFDLDPMQVQIGRLRPCPLFDMRFVTLAHNRIRGGAGGALLTAEMLYA